MSTTVHDLTEGEYAVLMAVRLWFRGGTVRSMAAIRAAFGAAGIPADALLPLFAMLGVFAAEGARRPSVLNPAMLMVGHDEVALLEALGALQHGNEDVALAALDRWLPLVGLCMATGSAQEFGRILAAAGVFLPYGRVAQRVVLAAE
ncbi:hypothetical protein [Azospirillum sp. TSO22-1]|uniref:hypothetical protein n=1 Tax=Azospirillum sp. TSO22-1 TaxID=716789 RepID=UPI000D64B216|nr:hypothetical protein [Azospirillum sp. TSO22-1]